MSMNDAIVCSKCKLPLASCTCPQDYGMQFAVTTATNTHPYPMAPMASVAMRATLIESDLEKIRAIVQEELAKAIAEESAREEEDNSPRMIHVPVEHPRTAMVEYVYEGVKYAGILTEVEEKYE